MTDQNNNNSKTTPPPCITVYADELAEPIRALGVTRFEVGKRIEADIRQSHPLALGIVTAVTYITAKGAYVVKFGDSSVLATTPVAEYLLTHATPGQTHAPKPHVYGRMTEGWLDSVLLRFLSRL